MNRRTIVLVIIYLSVAAGCGESPTAPPTPIIQLSPQSQSFAATAGGASPAPLTVNITNGGGGTLNNLAAALSYTAGQPTGWLSATLSGTTAPATLTLSAVTGSLDPGTYAAAISITSDVTSNSPQTLAVTFTLTAPPLNLTGVDGYITTQSATSVQYAIIFATNGVARSSGFCCAGTVAGARAAYPSKNLIFITPFTTIPPGTTPNLNGVDGFITTVSATNPSFKITFATNGVPGSGGYCCAATIAEARNTYPGKNLAYLPAGLDSSSMTQLGR